MRFAVPYYNKGGGKWMEKADEIIIKYKDNTEDALVTFIKNHLNQRIIVDILNFDLFESKAMNFYIFQNLKKKYELSNWALRFNVDTDRISEVENYMKDYNLSGFDENGKRITQYFYRYAAETFEHLDRLLYTSVSDIYITNALAFDMTRVKNKIMSFESPPNLRIYPNICQSYWDTKSIYSFFVRPEDVSLYENYVDVMEIYAETLYQKSLSDVYLEIYQKDKTWMGDLKEYLINCNESINNFYIFKDFGKRRLNCRKRCLIDNRCHFCMEQAQYIQLMEKTTDKIASIDSELAKQNIFIQNGDEGKNLETIQDYIGESKVIQNSEVSNEFTDYTIE